MARITHNEIKKIRSLNNKKFRESLELFVVEGEKMLKELLDSDFEIESVYHVEDIGEQAMKQISFMKNPSPVLAVVKKPEKRLPSQIDYSGGGLYVALDSIRDPGNLGTIIRLCDWFGADAVFASGDTVDLYNPKVVQATMGSIFRVPFYNCSLKDLLADAVKNGASVYGSFLHGNNLYEADLPDISKNAVFLVIGNESEGISDEISGLVTSTIHIPSFSKAEIHPDSLNAAIATAVILSELRRSSI